MSKPVKELLRKAMIKKLDGVTSLAIVGFTGLNAVSTHRVRSELEAKDIKLTVVKNSVARQAFEAVGLEGAKDLLDGPSAIAYGSDSVITVIRELLALGKESENLTVKAALLEGEAFGPDRIDALSKFPTRDEAIAKVAGTILAGGANLAACIIGPASKIASVLKTIEEKQSDETGETEAA